MPPTPRATTDMERYFALEERRLDICDGMLRGWQDTLRKCEKALEQSGGSVGRAAAAAPEGGTASPSTSSGSGRRQRERTAAPRRTYRPYPVAEHRQRSVLLHLYGLEWYLRDLSLSTALAGHWHHQCWNLQRAPVTALRS